MALVVPAYPDPRDPEHPVISAYAWISRLELDAGGGYGSFVVAVHPREAAWQAQPIQRVTVGLDPADLAVLLAEPEFGAAYKLIGDRLQRFAVERKPDFADAVPYQAPGEPEPDE